MMPHLLDENTLQLISFLGRIGIFGALATAIMATFFSAVTIPSFSNNGLKKLPNALFLLNLAFWIFGFLIIVSLHVIIYLELPLELPGPVIFWLNKKIEAMNAASQYGLPLIPDGSPPRYILPPWLEGEKIYFWFLCFSFLGTIAHFRLKNRHLSTLIGGALIVSSMIIILSKDPFQYPLPLFFQEIQPFFASPSEGFEKVSAFMSLYPKMIYYYNAHYMWLHPPLLFVSYALVQMTFLTSIMMFFSNEKAIEAYGYSCAKWSFFFLTIGMLLGYPWALKAWGPNWWWDPKIASSIMMWAIFSTYLHARIYLSKKGFWYLMATLGIVCFIAVVFTFVASYIFPGEHTLQ